MIECKYSKETNFITVGLDSARIDPGLKEALKNNIRRMQWQKWFKKEKRCWAKAINILFVRPFWWMSDYGSSTAKIIECFFLASAVLAAIYLSCSAHDFHFNGHRNNPDIRTAKEPRM